MYKKIFTVLIIVVLIVSVSGCGIRDALELDEDLHIELNWVDDDRIEYQGNIYYHSPIDFLRGEKWDIEATGEYEYLGWSGSRWFYSSHIFGNTKENPVFLYSTNTTQTLFREDYDYRIDTFLIDGTDDTFRICDDLLDLDPEEPVIAPYSEKINKAEITITSTTYPTLKANWTAYYIDDYGWFVYTNSGWDVFRLSEHFINILTENGILAL